MGTPEFAVPHLQSLAATGHTVIGVVTRPDRPAGRGRRTLPPAVKSAALELELPVYQPHRLGDASFRELMEELAPECICVVAYGAFLPKWLLDLPPAGCVNVHPSLLPKYRGAAPIQRAIMSGDAQTGVSTMYMSEEMDAGDIILQESVPISTDDDSGTLHDRLAEIGAHLLVQTVDLIAKGQAPRMVQDEAEVTFAPKIEPDDELIDWSLPSSAIDAQVRALRPRPGAYTYYEGRRLKVWRTRVHVGPGQEYAPGTVVEIGRELFQVATGDGMLEVLEVQPENGKRLLSSAFVNGYRLQTGVRLGDAGSA